MTDTRIAPPPGESLADQAYRLIEDMIVTMELRPGAWVSEPSLTERLEIGRTPVREALLRLASDGILVTRPRRGMVVCEIDLRTQLRVLEARRALESVIVRRAALRRSAEDVEVISGMVAEFRRMKGQPDHVPILRLDRAFMDRLLLASANPFLGAITPLYALSRRFWLANYQRQTRFDPQEITGYHIEIADAVIAGNAEEAGRLVDAFLDHVEEFTRFVGLELG
ncbi:GntR family transcriptional regulator [Oceanicella sp. SM1341]|uniref:GntR family transcriptional regulator n=1 Tax=Oceanicella sp. SM1341 TaxID=1548889 RepID=UPI000E4993C3|nr:GntR family transcriptional regulator [Oceanicella sp. SM1341]